MPFYATLCLVCAEENTIFRTIKTRDDGLICPCGGVLVRVLTPPMLAPDIEPYISPASGKLISSRKQRTEEMTRLGYRTVEPGVRADVARNRKAAEDKAFEPIAKTIEETVTALNNLGKLENNNV